MKNINFNQYNDKAIVLAFPDNWAKWHSKWSDRLYKMNISSNQYYKVGHAAILLVEQKTGKIAYYDFGRYTTGADHGRVRSQQTDPILKMETKAIFDNLGKIVNLENIILELDSLKSYTHGHGKIVYSVCDHIDYKKAKHYTDQLIKKCCIPYSPFAKNATNCSRFVAQVIADNCEDIVIQDRIRKQSTFTATPVGNVINASYKNHVNTYYKGKFEKPIKNRKSEFWDTVYNLLKSTKLSDRNYNHSHTDAIKTPEKLNTIPDNAQWINGIGEGAWLNIIELYNYKYLVQRYDVNGKLEYQITSKSAKFNIHEDYKIDYNSNRLITTIVQKDHNIKLYMIANYSSILRKSVSQR